MIIRELIIISMIFLISGCDSKSSYTNKNNRTKSIDKNISVDKNISNVVIEKREEVKFTLETIDGKTIHIKEIPYGLELKEFKGRPILLVMFGYRCPPCLREIPRLIEISNKHKDLAIVAIEVQGLSSSELKDFVELREINYNVISGNENIDFLSYIQYKADWHGAIPFVIGINKNGEVKIVQVGGLFESQLEAKYKELVK